MSDFHKPGRNSPTPPNDPLSGLPAQPDRLLQQSSTLQQGPHSQSGDPSQPDAADAARFLRLEGARNTRGFGAYPAEGGRSVLPGLLYRSDDLSRLSPSDLDELEKRGLKTVIDFRSSEIQNRAPDRLPPGARLVSLPIQVANMFALQDGDIKDGPAFMRETGRNLVDEAREQYREFFRIISDRENLPALFHCSAGKDRTGLAAALFLAALGAARELIFHDYLLSAGYIQGKYDFLLDKNPDMAPLLTVRPDYLQASCDEIAARYGGVENYLTGPLGADIARLRAIYLD